MLRPDYSHFESKRQTILPSQLPRIFRPEQVRRDNKPILNKIGEFIGTLPIALRRSFALLAYYQLFDAVFDQINIITNLRATYPSSEQLELLRMRGQETYMRGLTYPMLFGETRYWRREIRSGLLCLETGIVRGASNQFFQQVCPLLDIQPLTDVVQTLPQPEAGLIFELLYPLFLRYIRLRALLFADDDETDVDGAYQSYMEVVFNNIAEVTGRLRDVVYDRWWEEAARKFSFRVTNQQEIMLDWKSDQLNPVQIKALAYLFDYMLPDDVGDEINLIGYDMQFKNHLVMHKFLLFEKPDYITNIDALHWELYIIDIDDLLDDIRKGTGWLDLDQLREYRGDDEFDTELAKALSDSPDRWKSAFFIVQDAISYYGLSEFDDTPTLLNFREVARRYPFLASKNGWLFESYEIPEYQVAPATL